jgi:hypothetical protein
MQSSLGVQSQQTSLSHSPQRGNGGFDNDTNRAAPAKRSRSRTNQAKRGSPPRVAREAGENAGNEVNGNVSARVSKSRAFKARGTRASGKVDRMTGEGSSRSSRLMGDSMTRKPGPAPVVTVIKKRKLVGLDES